MFIYRAQSVLNCRTFLTSITTHRRSLAYIWHRYTEDSTVCPSLQRPWMISCLYLVSHFPISTVTIAINTKFTLTSKADGTNVDNHVIWRKGRKWATGKKTKRVADATGQRFPGETGPMKDSVEAWVCPSLSHVFPPQARKPESCSHFRQVAFLSATKWSL